MMQTVVDAGRVHSRPARRHRMLDQEIKYYESQHKDLLAKSEGKFVLVKESEILGIFASENAAYAEGLKRLGNEPFLIKQVTDQVGDTVALPAYGLGLIDTHI